ncbi:MAG: outer membrane protein assembly factor BamA [Endomicrobia bacterium]|nr:outer membrane protein assembly factor BamA [Endomicrobiia bacterium]MDW8056250.1 outer membrane protein assembly factor BamA [Elusimicrobiota bacterium]
MRKTNLIFLIFYTFVFSSVLWGQKIVEVQFQGLINVKLSEIKSKVKTKKGMVFVAENVKDDVQELLSTGYFDNVEVEFDTTTRRLIFKLYERPLVTKIDIRGNKKISSRKIKEEISLKEKEFYTEAKLIESKNKILDLYDEKGYIYTTVDSEIITDARTNHATVILLVNEGRKVIAEKIEIYGNKNFSKRKIMSLMETKRKKVYRESKIISDIQKIRDFYKEQGFYDIEVSSPIVEFITPETVKLVINIVEGVRYKISEIIVYGNTVYPTKAVMKQVTLKKGKIFKQSELQSTIQAIAELYAEKGYLKVNVEPEIEKSSKTFTMAIKLKIEEGEQVYVDKIWIEGLEATKEDVIRREILLKEGDLFNSKKLRRSLEKIYNLGFIDDVNINLEPGGRADSVDLVFTVKEGRPGMLSAGAGYSSVDKLVGNLQVSHLNLFGRAQRLNLLWEFGARRQNYEISWTEPWFLKKPMSFGISLYDLLRTRDYANEYNAYKERRQGLEFRLGPRISDVFSLLFSYSYETVTISESKFPQDVPDGTKLTSSFGSQLIYDTRDNVFDASRGMRQSLSVQVAGWTLLGGDVKYYKPILRSSFFIPTFWKFVLSFNTVFGYIEGIEGFDLNQTKYEKYYVGGADTVRGYGYRLLAPEDGGRIMFVFNTEYKFPIVQENKRTILQGAIFYDIGGAWENFGDVDFTIASTPLWEEQGKWDNKLKHSIGFGIRFTTPVFPIRLDWSWPLNPQKGRDTYQFWFTLGQIF